MAFDAHGSVQGEPTPQPVSSTPTSAPVEQVAPKVEAPAAPQTLTEKINQYGIASDTVEAQKLEWQPNFKFKVMDKEHEIPELLRSVIKDADSEKLIKELHEKAYGLDVVKPRFHETREELKSIKATHNDVMQGIQDLRESYSAGNFDDFFKKLNIPQEKILQWVIDKAQYNELPPEQRQVLDARRNAEQEALGLRKQNQSLEQQYEQAVIQAKETQLQFALERPEVKTFVESFNSTGFKNASGKEITFLDAVIETGEYAWYASKGKVDLTPEQAIQEVMARYGNVLNKQTPAPVQAPIITPQGNTQVQNTMPRKTNTLPNIAGRQNSSIAKSKPRSLEDLKKLALSGNF